MNLERAAMKGRLAEAIADKARLLSKAEAMHNQIRQMLNVALVPVEDCEIATVAALMDELVVTHAEIASINGQIARLNREIGR